MSDSSERIIGALPSIIADFFICNLMIFLSGIIIIGMSVSVKSDSQIVKDISTSLLHLGLMLFLTSLVAAVFCLMAVRGLKTWKKMLLVPLMIYLRVVPIMMSILILFSLVLNCLPDISGLAGLRLDFHCHHTQGGEGDSLLPHPELSRKVRGSRGSIFWTLGYSE